MQECHPRGPIHGEDNYSLTAPRSDARIQVQLKSQSFYLTRVASSSAYVGSRTFGWRKAGSAAAAWDAIKKASGFR